MKTWLSSEWLLYAILIFVALVALGLAIYAPPAFTSVNLVYGKF
jgi:hypothetical protein